MLHNGNRNPFKYRFFWMQKNTEHFTPISDLFVVNLAVNLSGAEVHLGKSRDLLAYNSSRLFSLLRKQQSIRIGNSADTSFSYYCNLDLGSPVYSIFIVGQTPTPEVIIKEESDLPFIASGKIYSATDSVVNAWFA